MEFDPSHPAPVPHSWLALCDDLGGLGQARARREPPLLPRGRKPPAPPLPRGGGAEQPPLHLYLQASMSFLLGARDLPGAPRPDFSALAVTSTGVALRLRVGEEGTAPGPAARARRATPAAWLNLNVGHPRYAALRQAARAAQAGGRAGAQQAYEDFQPRMVQLCDGMLDDAAASALAEELIARALSLAHCEHVAIDPRVHAAITLCDRAGDWQIGEIAQAVGLSASRLSHLFSHETGLSFRQYVQWIRTALAWEQVALAPQRLLTDIAHEHGYADLAHMSRSFQAVFGYAPSTLRVPGRWRIRGRPGVPGERVPPRWAPLPAEEGAEPHGAEGGHAPVPGATPAAPCSRRGHAQPAAHRAE